MSEIDTHLLNEKMRNLKTLSDKLSKINTSFSNVKNNMDVQIKSKYNINQKLHQADKEIGLFQNKINNGINFLGFVTDSFEKAEKELCRKVKEISPGKVNCSKSWFEKMNEYFNGYIQDFIRVLENSFLFGQKSFQVIDIKNITNFFQSKEVKIKRSSAYLMSNFRSSVEMSTITSGNDMAKKNNQDIVEGIIKAVFEVIKIVIEKVKGSPHHLTKEVLIDIGYSEDTLTDTFMNGLNYTIDTYIVADCTDKEKIKERIAKFIAQISVESEYGKKTIEDDYGDETYFYRTYKSEKKFGDIVDESNGLRRYCGGGYIMLTGRDNYEEFSKVIKNEEIYKQGIYYVSEKYAWQATGWWWKNNTMNSFIDKGATIAEVSKKVNGGTNGIGERKAVYNKVKMFLN